MILNGNVQSFEKHSPCLSGKPAQNVMFAVINDVYLIAWLIAKKTDKLLLIANVSELLSVVIKHASNRWRFGWKQYSFTIKSTHYCYIPVKALPSPVDYA